MNHVILGAGPAGVIAAETIRKHAPHDRVVIVGDEPEPPYSRMAIPYLLIGKVGEPGTWLRPEPQAHFAALRIDIKRARCTAIDVQRKNITLSDGSVLLFDRLLIATGSSPAQPPVPGITSPGVHTCWTLDDARAIAERAQPGARVIQMGAGFIGCIIMEALAMRGVKLSVVEMGDRMVPRMMGPTAGGMIKQWCEKKGVTVYTGARVESIAAGSPPAAAAVAAVTSSAPAPQAATAPAPGLLRRMAQAVGLAPSPAPAPVTAPVVPAALNPVFAPPADAAPLQVKLSTGQTLSADLVISATGVKPNIGFLENNGIRCLVGVLTDEHLQTNVPGIYAAGDCAEAFDKVSGTTIVSAIQPNAAEQARVAALNMVGPPGEPRAELKGVTQINVLDTLGLVSSSFGNWQGVPGGQHVELTEAGANRHLSLQFDGDKLVGCNSVGWVQHVGVMRGLVEGEVKLGAWKDTLMADPTQLMQAYLASAQAAAAPAHVK